MKKCPQCYDKNLKGHSDFDMYCSQCGSKLENKKYKYKITLPFVIELDCEDDLTAIKETGKLIGFFDLKNGPEDLKINYGSIDITRDGKFVHFNLKRKNKIDWICGCGHNLQTLLLGERPHDTCPHCGIDDDYHIYEYPDNGYTILVE